MDSSMLQIIILAGIVLFLVLQLRRVLGTRDGFEPTIDDQKTPPARASNASRDFEVIDGGGVDYDIADHIDVSSSGGQALAAMKRIEPDFNVTEFIGGARGAYEMILMAFENGTIDDMKDFLSDDVFESFSGAVAARQEQQLSIDADFVGMGEVKLIGADFDETSREASITMRFLGELTSVVKDSEGRIVEGDPNEVKRQRDVWTFVREMGSDNPNWKLSATGQ